MTVPLVTLGITCHNAAETIERSIRSAQRQTWPNLEIVVVDDASSDASAAVVESLAQSDPRIKLHRRPSNGGVAAARNDLVAAASGTFLMMQDDDDESEPERATLQVERLLNAEKTPEELLVCFASRLVMEDPPVYSRAMGVSGQPSGDALALHLLCGDEVEGAGRAGAGTMMARLSTFRAIGPFDETFRRAEEVDWMVRFALSGGSAVGCAEPLLVQHLTAGTEKGVDAYLVASLALCEKHRRFLSSHHAYRAARAGIWHHYHFAKGETISARLVLLLAFALRPMNGVRYAGQRLARLLSR